MAPCSQVCVLAKAAGLFSSVSSEMVCSTYPREQFTHSDHFDFTSARSIVLQKKILGYRCELIINETVHEL